MKKELYEKPNIEIISLINVDIITSSAGEGGGVDPDANGNSSNDFLDKLNEVDASPWARDNGEEGGHSFFDDLKEAIEQGSQEETPVDNLPQDTPVNDEEVIPDSVPEEIPTNNNSDIQ